MRVISRITDSGNFWTRSESRGSSIARSARPPPPVGAMRLLSGAGRKRPARTARTWGGPRRGWQSAFLMLVRQVFAGLFLPAPEGSRIAPTGGGGRADLAIEDPRLSDRVQKFPESVIREMTRIAALHDAINLSQGYPDFDPPRELTDAAKRALDAGYNQYSITWGAQELRDAIARRAKAFNGIDADPETNLVVTCGATEAMMV